MLVKEAKRLNYGDHVFWCVDPVWECYAWVIWGHRRRYPEKHRRFRLMLMQGMQDPVTVDMSKSPLTEKKPAFFVHEVRVCKVNGQPKTWKRSPGCVLSLKYGLYEYAQTGDQDRRECERVGTDVRILRVIIRLTNHDTRYRIHLSDE